MGLTRLFGRIVGFCVMRKPRTRKTDLLMAVDYFCVPAASTRLRLICFRDRMVEIWPYFLLFDYKKGVFYSCLCLNISGLYSQLVWRYDIQIVRRSDRLPVTVYAPLLEMSTVKL